MLKRKTLGLSLAVALTAILFVLSPSAWAQDSFKVLHPFSSANFPSGPLARDAAGNLYGTTYAGGGTGCGGSGCGTVWKLSPSTSGAWTASVIHVFNGPGGAGPGGQLSGGVILDKAGNLFGTTTAGGTSNGCASIYLQTCGVIFELSPRSGGGWTYKVLHNLDFTEGAYPTGSLVMDAAGNIYGTTQLGGSSNCFPGCGVVFKLTPNLDGAWTETVIHSFTDVNGDGQGPQAGLVLDAAGNLYGTTSSGGAGVGEASGSGIIFKLTPKSGGTWTEDVLYSFSGGPGGAYPSPSTLVFDGAGSLYGTATSSGANNGGVVYQLSPNKDGSWTETAICSFSSKPFSTSGSSPIAGVTFNANGNLYGTTSNGGGGDVGLVYQLTPTTNGWTEQALHSFWGYGAHPISSVLIDSAGNLYGTTSTGSGNFGLAFEVTP